jgi:hypothetical protein
MLESQGIFSLAMRSEATLTLARNVAQAQAHIRTQVSAQMVKSAYQAGSSLSGSGSGSVWNLMTSTSISPAAKLKAFLKDVLDKTDDNLITDDMMKRLEKASKSDNKEIAAEKLRQAKAKLQALRMQAQMAAATGDAKTLRRLAQEAAQAAHEVANAVRGLAGGIAATAETADGSASGTLPNAGPTAAVPPQAANAPANANTATASPETDAAPADVTPDAKTSDKPASPATTVPSGADPISWGRDALRKLADDAHLAIAQARGLIAFLAQAARAARKHRPDPDEDKAYRDLQRSVSDADADVDTAIQDATREMTSGSSDTAGTTDQGTADQSGADSGAGVVVESATVVVETTAEVTVGTDVTA